MEYEHLYVPVPTAIAKFGRGPFNAPGTRIIDDFPWGPKKRDKDVLVIPRELVEQWKLRGTFWSDVGWVELWDGQYNPTTSQTAPHGYLKEDDIEETSAGIPLGFGLSPVTKPGSGIKKRSKKPADPFPMIGTKFLSLVADPREVVVKDVSNDKVSYYPVGSDYGMPLIMPVERFLKLYEPQGVSESYVMGPIGAEMDAENDAGFPNMVIDLGAHRAGNLDEGLLGMMGAWIADILGAMFQGTSIPVKVRGTRSEIDSFSRALSREKKYLETFSRYGLDNPRTYKSKATLDKAVSQFERETGIKWPFKG